MSQLLKDAGKGSAVKAIQVSKFGDESVLKYKDAADLKPAADEVLIDVKAIGVNPVETYIRAGIFPIKPDLPYVPGTDAAGIVKAVGKEVKTFSVGDRVYTTGSASGTYAEQTVCKEGHVYPLSSKLTFEQGAAIGIPYATAYQALYHIAKIKPGNTILVHGASGGVGIAAVQLANASGLAVIASVGTEESQHLLRENGAHQIISHHNPDRYDEIMSATHGHGVDYILEMLSDQNLAKDLEILAFHGRVVVIGCRGEATINPRLLMSKDASIMGMTVFNANPQEVHSIHAVLFAGFENGSLKPFVGCEMPLKEAAEAHRHIMTQPAYGKLILKP